MGLGAALLGAAWVGCGDDGAACDEALGYVCQKGEAGAAGMGGVWTTGGAGGSVMGAAGLGGGGAGGNSCASDAACGAEKGEGSLCVGDACTELATRCTKGTLVAVPYEAGEGAIDIEVGFPNGSPSSRTSGAAASSRLLPSRYRPQRYGRGRRVP